MIGSNPEVLAAVVNDLRAVLRGLRDHKDGPAAAPIHHRLAVMRLQRGLIEDIDSVREALGPEYAEAVPTALDVLLARQLIGSNEPPSVLGALRPAVRAEAMLQLHEAMQCDAEHTPSLRAATALASVSGRWNEAVAWLERLAAVESNGRAAAALLALGDVHWKKLGQTDVARRCYLDAREEAPRDPKVLDKLLKLDLELSQWSEAVDTCRALIAQVAVEPEGKPLMVTYLLTLGEIHVYGLQEPAEALHNYLQALDAMPDYALTYTLVRELLEATPWATLKAAIAEADQEKFAPYEKYMELLAGGAEQTPEDAGAIVSGVRKAVLEV